MEKMSSKKQQTHKRMLDAASQSFRSNGYNGIGVDGIAKAAGVTSGAFYAHFGSKDKAFSAALDAGLNEVIETIPKLQKEGGVKWVQNFVKYYLGKSHRDDLACGCPLATLSPEVVRTGSKTHAAYEAKMKKIVELLAHGLQGKSRDECRSRAWAMLGILIGGLTMARAVKTHKATDEIASSIQLSALSVAGKARRVPDVLG